jgi:hypothetical protein
MNVCYGHILKIVNKRGIGCLPSSTSFRNQENEKILIDKWLPKSRLIVARRIPTAQ